MSHDVQAWLTYGIHYPPALGVDNEVPEEGFGGKRRLRIRDMIREICQGEGVDIIKGHVSKDHVHLFVSLPPQVTISRLVQRLKGGVNGSGLTF